MDQTKLLTILNETKEDLYKSLEQTLHRRFINDARRLREVIAIVSHAILKAETPDLSQQEIDQISTSVLSNIVIEDLAEYYLNDQCVRM